MVAGGGLMSVAVHLEMIKAVNTDPACNLLHLLNCYFSGAWIIIKQFALEEKYKSKNVSQPFCCFFFFFYQFKRV